MLWSQLVAVSNDDTWIFRPCHSNVRIYLGVRNTFFQLMGLYSVGPSRFWYWRAGRSSFLAISTSFILAIGQFSVRSKMKMEIAISEYSDRAQAARCKK